MRTNAHKLVAYELHNCIFMTMPLKAIIDASIHHDTVHSKRECDRELPREATYQQRQRRLIGQRRNGTF